MKKALLLVAVLAFSAPCFAQVAERPPARSSSGSSAVSTSRFVGRNWVQVDTYDSFDSGYSVGTSSSSSTSFRVSSGPSITVYGASGPWLPSVKDAGGDWTFMLFGDPGKLTSGAFNSTPSLGAVARMAREAKTQQQQQAEAPLKIKMDGNGALVVAPRK